MGKQDWDKAVKHWADKDMEEFDSEATEYVWEEIEEELSEKEK